MSDDLVRRIEALEERIKHHGATILEHGTRLDRHERQLAELRAGHVETRTELKGLSQQVTEVRSEMKDLSRQVAELQATNLETRAEVRAMSTQVGRLSDIATTQGLSLEKIDRNVVRLVEIFETRKVVVDADS